MKSIGVVLLCLLLPSACARLPRIHEPTASQDRYAPSDCLGIYPRGEWQFVHIIEAEPPNHQKYTMTGVVRVSTEHHTLHCVLLTLEGLVLFEGRIEKKLDVLRALPPFDAPGYARGLSDDLRLIFLPPQTPPQACGYTEDGVFVCRYPGDAGSTRDIVLLSDGSWQIRCYGADAGLTKTLGPVGLKTDDNLRPFPDQLILKTHGMLGYDLTLTLVEARRTETASSPEKAIP